MTPEEARTYLSDGTQNELHQLISIICDEAMEGKYKNCAMTISIAYDIGNDLQHLNQKYLIGDGKLFSETICGLLEDQKFKLNMCRIIANSI